MFERPSEKEIKKLRPKIKMGGPVTRNGVDVSKEIEKQTAKKFAKANALAKMKKPSISGSEAKGIKKVIDSALKD